AVSPESALAPLGMQCSESRECTGTTGDALQLLQRVHWHHWGCGAVSPESALAPLVMHCSESRECTGTTENALQ
ncbi:hypothetical protein NAB22_18865, partial [Proteus mirabilis]|nr:hypothetical protein [Proteus mirabilis]